MLEIQPIGDLYQSNDIPPLEALPGSVTNATKQIGSILLENGSAELSTALDVADLESISDFANAEDLVEEIADEDDDLAPEGQLDGIDFASKMQGRQRELIKNSDTKAAIQRYVNIYFKIDVLPISVRCKARDFKFLNRETKLLLAIGQYDEIYEGEVDSKDQARFLKLIINKGQTKPQNLITPKKYNLLVKQAIKLNHIKKIDGVLSLNYESLDVLKGLVGINRTKSKKPRPKSTKPRKIPYSSNLPPRSDSHLRPEGIKIAEQQRDSYSKLAGLAKDFNVNPRHIKELAPDSKVALAITALKDTVIESNSNAYEHLTMLTGLEALEIRRNIDLLESRKELIRQIGDLSTARLNQAGISNLKKEIEKASLKVSRLEL